MSKPVHPPHVLQARSREDQDEDLFASPESGQTTQEPTPSSSNHKARPRSDSESRNVLLRAELDRIRHINSVISSATASLEKAKANMSTVQSTVENASTLLGTWTRILSQTEHNQRLILDPQWQGAAQDLEDEEHEQVRRREDRERRVREEERRREEGERKREEEERRKAMAPAATTSRRGSVRGARGTAGTGRGYTGVGGQTGRGRGTTAGAARGSGIGRGTSSTGRGRGRGVG